MAHNLGLSVVAEGVETAGQLVILRSLGCDVSQGFFLHRPLAVSAVEAVMKEYASKQRPALFGNARKVAGTPVTGLIPEPSLV